LLRDARVSHLLGVPVPRKEIERYLSVSGSCRAEETGWRAVPAGARSHAESIYEEVHGSVDTFRTELRPTSRYRPDAPSELTLHRSRGLVAWRGC